MRRRLDGGALPWPLFRPANAYAPPRSAPSEYSVQPSGNTTTTTASGALLPAHSQVLAASTVREETIDPDKLAAAIRGHLTSLDLAEGTEVALTQPAIA